MNDSTAQKIEEEKCLNCGSLSTGPYCHNCGQNNKYKRLDIRQLLGSFYQNIFNLDATYPKTLYNGKASVPGFDIAGATYPAVETNGDYFDFIPMPDGNLLITVGDVTGHGIGAALIMA